MEIEEEIYEICKHELYIPIPLIIKKDGFRVTLCEPFPDFYLYMLKLERLLQEVTKKPIDLRCESIEDKNKRAKRNGRE